MAVPGFTLSAFVFLLHVNSVASYPNGKVTKSCHRMVPEHGHSPQSEPTHHMAGSAVSHTSSSKKTEIKVYWKAPSSAPNHIRFLATVVEKYKIYWVKIPSQIISQPNALLFTTPKATTAPSSTSPPISHLTKPFSASDCGNKKFCIRSPLNCDPEKEHTCVFLSFMRDEQSVVVEMSGPGEGYLSFAFSRDRWMGNDDAYMCIREDQTVHIQPSHLTGRSHPMMDSRGPLEDMAWRLVDGIMQCSFRRKITLPGVKNRFDLNTSYYIFLADGAAFDGRIYKHPQQPLITHDKHDVTDSPKDVGGSRSSLLLKVHAALMFVAWMSTVSMGVLIARFFRPVWSKAFFFGEAVWFQLHRMLMLTTSVLTCIAFVMPFIYRGGWSWKTYAMIGFVIWHIGTEVVLEIHAYRLSRKVEILDDDRIQILQSFTVSEAEGHTFKKTVLAVYVCGNVTFLIIFLSAISHV
ncbi:Ferric-chelate reductase 1 [Heterocephalus glaber]|uniref:Ferric-chelate reductase 1 n=1 Tax=Heterocephalus glaber TaxID=10181 RepID=G5C718_HETGA|nr:Ferric-chelate reductase 1 [Heterocephalus glaber]